MQNSGRSLNFLRDYLSFYIFGLFKHTTDTPYSIHECSPAQETACCTMQERSVPGLPISKMYGYVFLMLCNRQSKIRIVEQSRILGNKSNDSIFRFNRKIVILYGYSLLSVKQYISYSIWHSSFLEWSLENFEGLIKFGL